MALDITIKDKWTAALRSGRYKQTTGELKGVMWPSGMGHGETEMGHCCLGVVLDECLPGGVEEWRDPHEEVIAEEGLARIALDHRDQMTLAGMNDEGKPFAEIADWIQENL